MQRIKIRKLRAGNCSFFDGMFNGEISQIIEIVIMKIAVNDKYLEQANKKLRSKQEILLS